MLKLQQVTPLMRCLQFHRRISERGNLSLTYLSCRTFGLMSAWSSTLFFRELVQCYVRVSATRTWIRPNSHLVSSSSSQPFIWSVGYSASTGATWSFWGLKAITNSWKHSLEEANKRVNRYSKQTRSHQCETHMRTKVIPELEENRKLLNDCKKQNLKLQGSSGLDWRHNLSVKNSNKA